MRDPQRNAVTKKLDIVGVRVTTNEGQTMPVVKPKRLSILHSKERFPGRLIVDLQELTEVAQKRVPEQPLRQRRITITRVQFCRDDGDNARVHKRRLDHAERTVSGSGETGCGEQCCMCQRHPRPDAAAEAKVAVAEEGQTSERERERERHRRPIRNGGEKGSCEGSQPVCQRRRVASGQTGPQSTIG